MWSVEWVIKSIVDNHRVFERRRKKINRERHMRRNVCRWNEAFRIWSGKKPQNSTKANIEILRVFKKPASQNVPLNQRVTTKYDNQSTSYAWHHQRWATEYKKQKVCNQNGSSVSSMQAKCARSSISLSLSLRLVLTTDFISHAYRFTFPPLQCVWFRTFFIGTLKSISSLLFLLWLVTTIRAPIATMYAFETIEVSIFVEFHFRRT